MLAALTACAAPAVRAAGVEFKSAEAAFDQGMSALRTGYTEQAISALQFAASKNHVLARYYLARLLADSNTPFTNQGAAYKLYEGIVAELLDIDPDVDQRAPFVAKALTAVAGYLKTGLPEANLEADPERAYEYFYHAATFFNDEGAQFELAKIYLEDKNDPESARRGIDWLSKLAQRGHAGAQAQLAAELWRGRHVPKDQLHAFALIGLAVENAPPSDRIWIEDIYQKIYCGSAIEVRQKAQSVVAEWRRRYARTVEVRDHSPFAAMQPKALRTCSDGERVEALNKLATPDAKTIVPAAGPDQSTVPSTTTGSGTITSRSDTSPAGPLTGSLPSAMMGFAVKDAGMSLQGR